MIPITPNNTIKSAGEEKIVFAISGVFDRNPMMTARTPSVIRLTGRFDFSSKKMTDDWSEFACCEGTFFFLDLDFSVTFASWIFICLK